MASETDDLEQVIRQNLRLRRELGAAVAKAENGNAKQSGDRLLGSAVERAETALENDLEELRLELRLRRATHPAVAKGDVEFQHEAPRAPRKDLEGRWLRVDRKAWGLLGLVCLGLAALVLWLIYG
jgi:hypothetical protein